MPRFALRPRSPRRALIAVVAVGLTASLTIGVPPRPVSAATLPPGFSESVVFSGLTWPTAVRFSPDGRVFVAEKSGLIKVFDSLSDPTPDIFADLSANVFNGWDRGLLGLALDPSFPTNPYVYVSYTYDHILGGPPGPRWGGGLDDNCPTPPGPNTDGCVVSGRVSRLRAAGNAMTGSEQVLIEDWCNQYPSHSLGALQFAADGSLYVGGGDGASYDFVDYGQAGIPLNPCGDPPTPPGTAVTPPTAEGGALRSQDLRTTSDPTGLNGTILRIDPATGAALPTNPLFGSSDANARRIIAYGLRNPFRFAVRPGTNEIWVDDVGWTEWEEINRITDPVDSVVENFGWPCYEGMGRQAGYDAANLNVCENLYTQANADTKPYATYSHNSEIVPGDGCVGGSSAFSGAAFQLSGSQDPYPAAYDNAFFFADYGRGCIWVMKADASGTPSPSLVAPFVTGASTPVDLVRGPGGQIYYVDIVGGTIRRIDYAGTNQAPTLVSAPSVSGTPQVGATLTRLAGVWSGTQPISLAYQWQQCAGGTCANIAGATGTSYVVAAADLGKTLRVHETATNSVGSASADSAQTATVTQASGSAYRSAVLADTPFLYWGLGEASGTFADLSGRGNTGSAVGSGLSRGVPALAGSTGDGALTFTDGTSYVNGATVAGLSSSAISAEVWFKVNAFANWSDLASHNWGGTGGAGWAMYVDATGALSWGLWAPGGSEQNVIAPSLTVGTTYHAVGTYDGSVLRLYLNGALVASRTVGAISLDTTAGVFSGKTDTAAGVTVDELALYGTSLSAARIGAHYTAGTGGGGTNQAPTANIVSPVSTLTWRVGDTISFSGTATDPEDGTLPASAFTWTLLIQHCPSTCHTHVVQTFSGVSGGSFSAPDHEYPSYLELQLSVHDSQGLATMKSVSVYPKTVDLTFVSSPAGLGLTLNATTNPAPWTKSVILGSTNSISASDQTVGGTAYTFQSWSDGGAATHNVVANASATLTATFTGGGTNQAPTLVSAPSVSGTPQVGATLTRLAGVWSGTQPISLAYQWQQCAGGTCANIAGATGTSYVVAAADLGKTLRVHETATNSVGSASADSAQTATVTQASGSAYRSAVLADSPRLLWGLGDASGAFTDASGNGNSATATGTGMTRAAAGIVTTTTDGALTFTDGTSYCQRTAAVSGLSASVVSVEVWFKASAYANWSDLAAHNWGGTGGAGWDLYLSSDKTLTWGLWASGGTENSVRSAALTANAVYHAVGTYDGSVLRLYLNGALVVSKTVGAVALNTSVGVFTGKTDTTSPLTVDELAVYATSLSAARVAAHYAAGR